ncbi:ybak/Prolyl-Trna synthetase associated region [Arthrobacter sp. Hiyo8]|nr:ybak/Prolyl-Trna synthetase associated region [Arthrobacter sp. Hiyo8]
MRKATETIPASVLNVKSALTAAGAQDTVLTFDDDVPTAAAAASLLGCDIAAIANSLVFELDGTPLLILASGPRRWTPPWSRIPWAQPGSAGQPGLRLGAHRPGRRRRGSLWTPAALRTILDISLQEHPLLWAGAGDHNSMFSISYSELQRITAAQPLKVR